ncbi:hypothetical protein ACTG9Q_15295 [Actinokineospora sp. 24-640]
MTITSTARARLMATAGSALLVLAAACGGAQDGGAARAPEPIPLPTPGPSTTRTAGPTATTMTTTTPRSSSPAPRTTAARQGGSCPVAPADSVWRSDVSRLPVLPASDDHVAAIGAGKDLKADFGSGLWEGAPIGIPVTVIGQARAAVPVSFEYAEDSDPGPYPIPRDARVEGGSSADGDRHVIVLRTDTCTLYELWHARPTGAGWAAGSGAVFDLRSNALRPDGHTSADAAGLPIYPGLARYDEVAAGRIDHALRITVPRTRAAHVWPARHHASARTDPALPPMGLRLRLRGDADLSGLGPQARVIARALQRHGAIVADNGSAWYVSGTEDPRWDNDDLATLGTLGGSDFDAVDTSGLMVSPNSARARG